MATNQYFSRGSRSEQNLYEDLIIESLKMYGQDVYYIPREIVNRDRIFDDDVPQVAGRSQNVFHDLCLQRQDRALWLLLHFHQMWENKR